jgi:hypothetical protein
MGLFDKTGGAIEIPADLAERAGPVLTELLEERARQDAKWGGPDHDDAHNLYDWCGYISDRVGMIRPGDVTLEGIETARRRLVEAGALCSAAVESLDRNLARLAGEQADRTPDASG